MYVGYNIHWDTGFTLTPDKLPGRFNERPGYEATMYREAGARRYVYFNPQHAGMHTRVLLCLGAAWERCQIHASARKSVVLVFHNGGLKAALNTKV